MSLLLEWFSSVIERKGTGLMGPLIGLGKSEEAARGEKDRSERSDTRRYGMEGHDKLKDLEGEKKKKRKIRGNLVTGGLQEGERR